MLCSYLQSAYTRITVIDSVNSTYQSASLQPITAAVMQAQHNRSGIMRTVVKDNNDLNATSTLDSDGQYDTETSWPANATFLNVSNGAWHMATVTTSSDGSHGYLVYIDGQLAGNVSHTCLSTVVDAKSTAEIVNRVTYVGDPCLELSVGLMYILHAADDVRLETCMQLEICGAIITISSGLLAAWHAKCGHVCLSDLQLNCPQKVPRMCKRRQSLAM